MIVKKTAALILLSTVFMGVACSKQNDKEVKPTLSGTALEQAQPSDPFRDAVNKATQAAEFSQSASSFLDWPIVASSWQSAIQSMSSVPESNSNYSVAQKKVLEYQSYSDIAKKKASLNSSCSSDKFPFYLTAQKIDGKIQFTAETQLPDATQVMFNLSGHGYTAQSKVETKNGLVVSEGFSSSEKPLEGNYTLEVLSHFNKIWQSETILLALNQLSSPCIKKEEGIAGLDQVFSVKVDLKIDSIEVAQQEIQSETIEAKRIFEEAQILLTKGEKNIEFLRQNPNSPMCFNDLQERMKQAKTLQAQADKLSNERFDLKVAVTNLVSCSTCSKPTVETYCSESKKYLESIKNKF